VLFDPSKLQKARFRIKVDVGPSNYWSELTSVQTLDNMLEKGILDAIQYLERLPEGYVPMRDELIEELRQRQEMEAQEQRKKAQYEQMAQFIDSLQPEEQARLQALPPDQMEAEVLSMMGGMQGGMSGMQGTANGGQ
jgi:hypothetical protein